MIIYIEKTILSTAVDKSVHKMFLTCLNISVNHSFVKRVNGFDMTKNVIHSYIYNVFYLELMSF